MRLCVYIDALNERINVSFLFLSERSLFEANGKEEKVMMNDNLYISSSPSFFDSHQERSKRKTTTSSVIFNHPVCPIASGLSLKCVCAYDYLTARSNPALIQLPVVVRWTVRTDEDDDDECDRHSSMDNFASSITQMLSKERKRSLTT